MDDSIKQVVSMLVSSDKITLFTVLGELIEIRNDEDYDTTKISAFLTPKLTGLAPVEINLDEYSRIAQILPSDLEEHGIVITQIINGREVQGIFYPRKVAVSVTVGNEQVTIPDVENLTGHIKRAVDEKSPSVANFLKRLAPVIQKRKHSGEDLMKFIKQSEMPLTNDGRIIAYKRVKRSNNEGTFVDCHTGMVKQRVGSLVKMDVDMVDPSRHNSCSTGLHVANLGYMKGFSGSHTLIVLVNPEDFIAVPEGEDTKARVCAYQIIGVMSNNAHEKVNTGSHVTGDTSLQQLIKSAVEGQISSPIEEVHVGRHGTVVSISQLAATPLRLTNPVAVSSGKSLNEDAKPEGPKGDVLETTRAAIAETTGTAIPDDVIKAFDMLISGDTKTLVADLFHTSTRSIGRWMEKYNFDSYKAAYEASLIGDELQDEDEYDEDEDYFDEVASQIIDNLTQKDTPVSDEDFAALVQSSTPPKPPTKVEQMRKLYNNWVLGGFKEEDLKAMKLFKSASKKSWNALGLTPNEEHQIAEE